MMNDDLNIILKIKKEPIEVDFIIIVFIVSMFI